MPAAAVAPPRSRRLTLPPHVAFTATALTLSAHPGGPADHAARSDHDGGGLWCCDRHHLGRRTAGPVVVPFDRRDRDIMTAVKFDRVESPCGSGHLGVVLLRHRAE
jgi:hypothetical protein